jgi:hypothetical protein
MILRKFPFLDDSSALYLSLGHALTIATLMGKDSPPWYLLLDRREVSLFEAIG